VVGGVYDLFTGVVTLIGKKNGRRTLNSKL
jgi:hypothetical protein